MLPSNHPLKSDLKLEFLRCLNFLTSTDISDFKSDLINLYPERNNSVDFLSVMRVWENMKNTATYLSPLIVSESLPTEATNNIQTFVQKIDFIISPQENHSFDIISSSILFAGIYLNAVGEFYPKPFIEGKFNQNLKYFFIF